MDLKNWKSEVCLTKKFDAGGSDRDDRCDNQACIAQLTLRMDHKKVEVILGSAMLTSPIVWREKLVLWNGTLFGKKESRVSRVKISPIYFLMRTRA